MSNADNIRWFKKTFGEQIEAEVAGTCFTVEMLVAVALQETGYIWGTLKDKVDVPRLLYLCVGDTLDAPNRSAFPRNRGELENHEHGKDMFKIGRQALLDMAQYIHSYRGAASNPNKFCHGYGIWQYDIQFFKTDPDYFLQKKWANLDEALGKCLGELKHAQQRAHLGGASKKLTNDEAARVAIAYNRGSYDPKRGLKQGYKDSSGTYYGESFMTFLRATEVA